MLMATVLKLVPAVGAAVLTSLVHTARAGAARPCKLRVWGSSAPEICTPEPVQARSGRSCIVPPAYRPSRWLTARFPIAVGEMLVAERHDLALDSGAQRAQQQTQLDVHLQVVLRYGHGARSTGPLEVENVSFPIERSAVVVLQSPRDRLCQALGFRQSEVMLPANVDGRHCFSGASNVSPASGS